MIRSQDQGSLTWRSIWIDIIGPVVMGDATKVADYTTFLEYCQIGATKRPPATAGGAERGPATACDFQHQLIPAGIRDQALHRLRLFLPGLQAITGLGAQLQNLHQQFVTSQVQLAANATKVTTLQSKNLPLYQMLTRICETNNEADFGPYWVSQIKRKPGEYLGLMTQAMSVTCRGLGVPPLILSPALAADIGSGTWVSADFNNVVTGLSIFRCRTAFSTTAAAAQERNYVYNMVGIGGGVVNVQAAHLILANNEVDPPKSSAELRAYLEGYYGFLVCFFGSTSRLVTAYQTHIYNRLHTLQIGIDTNYPDQGTRNVAYLRVMVYIWRQTNRFVVTILATDPALAASVPPPRYDQIEDDLSNGRLHFLTEIPPTLATTVLPTAPPQQLYTRPPAQPAAPPANPPAATGTSSNPRVENRTQNQNLKSAWTALGLTSVFGAGSPYLDPSLPAPHRKVIPADAPDTRRVCLPFALTGNCYSSCGGKHEVLSASECQRVAQAGGLTLSN